MTDGADPPDDEVGYGKPPVAHRFKPGQSGNPGGRPKGSKNALGVFDKALRETVTVVENGRRRKISKLDALAKQHVNKAVSGDARAAKFVLDLTEGHRKGEAGAPAETPVSIEAQKARDMELLAALRERLSPSAVECNDEDT